MHALLVLDRRPTWLLQDEPVRWFEGSGYTPKAMCDTNSKDFATLLHKLADDIYLVSMSTALRTGAACRVVPEDGGDSGCSFWAR